MSNLFDTIEEVQEPVVDLAVSRRTIMMASCIRAAALSTGVVVGAMAMKIKPSTIAKAAVIPAVIELGTTYAQVHRADEDIVVLEAAATNSKTHFNDAAINFVGGAVAIVGGAVIARWLKGPDLPAE